MDSKLRPSLLAPTRRLRQRHLRKPPPAEKSTVSTLPRSAWLEQYPSRAGLSQAAAGTSGGMRREFPNFYAAVRFGNGSYADGSLCRVALTPVRIPTPT